MSKTSPVNKLLETWVQDWKKENLSPETITLISQANYDLWHGPINNGAYGDPARDDESLKTYPGFTAATKTIAQALSRAKVPRELYLDVDSEQVTDSEPEPEKCEDCDNEGMCHYTDQECWSCHGRGCFDAAGDWYHVEHPDILAAIVGTELSKYL